MEIICVFSHHLLAELDLRKGVPNLLAQSGVEFNLVPQRFVKVHTILEPMLSLVLEHFSAYKVEINRLGLDVINVIFRELSGRNLFAVVLSDIYELK